MKEEIRTMNLLICVAIIGIAGCIVASTVLFLGKHYATAFLFAMLGTGLNTIELSIAEEKRRFMELDHRYDLSRVTLSK